MSDVESVLAAHMIGYERRAYHWADRLARALLASDWLAAREAAAEARGAERALREAAGDIAQGRLGIDFAEAAEELDARAAAAGGAR